MKFRNEAYSDLVSDLILDAFYIDRPNRGKIATKISYKTSSTTCNIWNFF
jgi:hypothetical protein